MANVDAFNEGFDAGWGKTKKPSKKLNNGKKKDGGGGNDGPVDLVPAANQAIPKGFKKGGKVKRTGVAKVHKGEYVLSVKQTKKYVKNKGTRKRVASKR